MDIEIRRNRDIRFDFEMKPEQKKELEMLLSAGVHQEMLNEAKRIRYGIEQRIWHYIKTGGIKDLDGNPITPETHEIKFDVGMVKYEGDTYAIPSKWYVRPKKSEYEK